MKSAFIPIAHKVHFDAHKRNICSSKFKPSKNFFQKLCVGTRGPNPKFFNLLKTLENFRTTVKFQFFFFYRSEMLSSEKSYRKRSKMNVKAAKYPKCSGFHSSFSSRNDFLIKIFSQYRWR
jgi:hypothetical protein